jgi:hypothetical protein
MPAFAPVSLIKTVAAAATPEAISSANLTVLDCTIQAIGSACTVGDSNVVHAVDETQRGIRLAEGESVHFDHVDLSKVYVDTSTNGDGVSVVYFPAVG